MHNYKVAVAVKCIVWWLLISHLGEVSHWSLALRWMREVHFPSDRLKSSYVAHVKCVAVWVGWAGAAVGIRVTALLTCWRLCKEICVLVPTETVYIRTVLVTGVHLVTRVHWQCSHVFGLVYRWFVVELWRKVVRLTFQWFRSNHSRWGRVWGSFEKTKLIFICT